MVLATGWSPRRKARGAEAKSGYRLGVHTRSMMESNTPIPNPRKPWNLIINKQFRLIIRVAL